MLQSGLSELASCQADSRCFLDPRIVPWGNRPEIGDVMGRSPRGSVLEAPTRAIQSVTWRNLPKNAITALPRMTLSLAFH